MDYIYDGSFEGLLTAIFEAYIRREVPDRIITDRYIQESLLSGKVRISTDMDKAVRVSRSIREKISPLSYKNIYYTYLSGHEESGLWIHHYLKLGWKVGKEVDFRLTEQCVLRIHDTVRRVWREKNKLAGFLRFKVLSNGIYYAPVEPDNNIIGLLAPHFAERFQDQNWIIHDLKRNLAVLYNTKEWIATPFNSAEISSLYSGEEYFQDLWKEYFKKLSIENRKNPRLQKQNMPVRYWKHMTEKQG